MGNSITGDALPPRVGIGPQAMEILSQRRLGL